MKKSSLYSKLFIGGLSISFLVACSSNQTTSSSSQSVSEGNNFAFVQKANENVENIWYVIEDSNDDYQLSKDDKIETVYLTKNGKMDVYHVGSLPGEEPLTLSFLKDKSNSEIKELVRQSAEAHFSEILEYNSLSTKISIDDLLNRPVKATVETDSTGNTVVEETIRYATFNVDSDNNVVPDESYNTFNSTISGYIYDTYYVGYAGNGTTKSSFLVISAPDENVSISFDTLDTENVSEE
ncbi:hypothetical protein ACTGJ2_06950 [Streptococcus suis]|uniref:hypothetical protein n=1 Tax=Streptococcus TaxID=1301 RepID=UPI000CF5B6EA|nr:hypothetical protein [Streptococcus suis]MCL4922732.1 hypothetical protein [Streptococcus suis]MDD7565113.1 hypothetical protein [Streptococcus suis]MDY5054881.1 hypothetical protein [Streptococcus suis]NQP41614.1 hypothetical protein [Streptococcus suis]HEM4702883.1 hypothetical protein [Streptococcus suis]